MVVKWKDKRDILMISTKHTVEAVTVRKNNYIGERPIVVFDYNFGKSAADLSDQMIAYSTPHRKALKWYIKLVINVSVANALLLHKLRRKRKINISNFRLAMHLTQCCGDEAFGPSNMCIERRLRMQGQYTWYANIANCVTKKVLQVSEYKVQKIGQKGSLHTAKIALTSHTYV
ncbi:unnamed protein product [Xylocopa violacea]|uniref:PiggyBac transposable element-derived protein domain-containing protein n=1 Tax=Xylocopa violacea TaxID=135666 RepID=A0ABP1NPZ3_XYLVO